LSAGLLSLTRAAAPCHPAGCDHVLCSRQCARGGSAASPGPTPLTSGAAPRHRAERDFARRSHPCVRKGGQQRQQALQLLRASRRHAIVPNVISFGATFSAGRRGGQHRQLALYLSRAWQRHAVMPEAFAHCAAVSSRGKSQQRLQALHPWRAVRRHAIVPNVTSLGAAIRACGKGPAASAGPTSLTSDAAPCHRAGCDHVLCAVSACESVSSVSRPHHSYERRGATPSCRS